MKKLLSVIALTLLIISQLQLYAAAAADVYVYPQLRIMYGEGLEDYQQLNAGLTLIPSGDDQFILDYTPTMDSDAFDFGYNGTGIIIPLVIENDLDEAYHKSYINNYSMQIWLKDTGNYDPSSMIDYPPTAILNSVYSSSGYDADNDDYVNELTLKSSKGMTDFHYSGDGCDVYYTLNYSPRNSDGDISAQDYFGVLNIDVTTVFYVRSSLPERLFLSIDFTNLFRSGFDYRIQINESKTAEVVNTNIDDVNSKLSELQSLLNQLNQLIADASNSLGSLGESFSPDGVYGGSQFDSLGDVLGALYSESYINNMILDNNMQMLQEKNEEIREQIDDLNENMTDYVEQADQNTKDTFVKDATDKLDENVQAILDKVDIINTDAIQSNSQNLFEALSTDSMRPVLTVPAFTINLLGDSHTLWDEFTVDLVSLFDQMGISDYMIWFRFIFYFGFGWFLYSKVSRIMKIVLLDPVSEDTPK